MPCYFQMQSSFRAVVPEISGDSIGLAVQTALGSRIQYVWDGCSHMDVFYMLPRLF